MGLEYMRGEEEDGKVEVNMKTELLMEVEDEEHRVTYAHLVKTFPKI